MGISKALGWAKTPAGIVAVVAAGAVGGLGAATWTLAQPVTPASVVVHQVADTSMPTDTATVSPVVVPTTVAPTPVESTQAPVQAAPTSEALVAKAKAPAPVVAPANSAPAAAPASPAPPRKYGNPGTYSADATGEHWTPAPTPTN